MLRRLLGCFRPYVCRDSYRAQIEGSAFLNLRAAYTAAGLACWPMRGRRADDRWWQRRMPLLSVVVWAHTGQCGQRWVFAVTVLGRRVAGYRTAGDATPAMLTYEDRGWYLWGVR